jgi:4-amino-4-deoxy-L-arabinose transferase-like glycosyltransferase
MSSYRASLRPCLTTSCSRQKRETITGRGTLLTLATAAEPIRSEIRSVVNELAIQSRAFSRAPGRELAPRAFAAGIALTASTLAAALGVFIHAWPPHEDETLALFIGRGSFPSVLHEVIAERGGAPLHFLFAWLIVHLGGGLTALRIVSIVFAIASVPAIALLGSKLADRTIGLVAALLAGGTWVFLFHGIYGRMYSLFLLTSTLSFIALLHALEHGGRRRFALWGIALLAALASHPYAVLVVAAQALYVVLRGERRRAALWTLAVVAVVALPFWWADLVLRGRFDVGVGGGGTRLGTPAAVAHYFWWVAGDFSAGPGRWLALVLLLAAVGFVLLARRRKTSGLLTACVILVPAMALTVVRLQATASPQARHLIFALPFFSTLLATTLVDLARARPRITGVVACAAIAALLGGEIRWADERTPPLFHGVSHSEAAARANAARWLAETGRPNDVLLGYEPLYLLAWERNSSFSRYAIPRADPRLFAASLRSVPEPLGRGVWAFDASDTTNVWERQSIRFALPRPTRAFEGRVFGPYLVIRTRAPLRTRARYLAVSEEVMRLGRTLDIGDADVNLHTMLLARKRI